ncbi:1112063KZM23467.1 methyltransferase [Pyrenophora seminiperda CCB06]|uniref:1112063KZM23467.1 methyltransferase n=1 Tax=Pyrenophora seminiperda CCB06 TaxID=1302712 RepID=A0A3M7LW70_9PLEO|nr:1112063KZM23467.1 methyltransferase [Pyrenophora seminiperda CCB06]
MDEAATYNYITGSDYPQRLYNGLVQALRGFPNLKLVRIRAKSSEPLAWRLNMPDDDQLFRTRCFQTLLDAIIGSEVNLEEFAMTKAGPNATPQKGVYLSCSGFKLPPQKLQSLQSCFSHLQSLTVSVDTDSRTDKRTPGWEHTIADFITTAPKLRKLTLSLGRGLFGVSESHYGAAIIRSLSTSCRLGELEQFRLHKVVLHGDDLATLIRAHSASLQKLVFSEIHLQFGDWSSMWKVLRECERLKILRLSELNGEKSPIILRRRHEYIMKRSVIKLNAEKNKRSMSNMLDDLIVACDAQTEPTSHSINVYLEDVR